MVQFSRKTVTWITNDLIELTPAQRLQYFFFLLFISSNTALLIYYCYLILQK